MQKLRLVAVVAVLIFTGCKKGKVVKWNGDIQPEMKSEIKTCTDSIMDAVATGNPQKLRHFFSDSLLKETGTFFDSIVVQMNHTIQSSAYSVLDECYIKNPQTGERDSVHRENKEDQGYQINFDAITIETYASLLLHEVEDGQLLITCIYGKYSGGWKLNTLRIGRYSLYGNTAIDIYKKAKDNYEKGDVMDAANQISLARKPLKPAFQFFQFDKDSEIRAFAKKILGQADTTFRFPNLIAELKSEPTIYNIRPMAMKEGIFPAITYGTQIPLRDTAAVKKENDAFQKIIGQLFPGMEKNNKFIFFQAYQQTSNGLNPGLHLEFVMHGAVDQP